MDGDLSICAQCGGPAAFDCARCKGVRYCGPKCQRAAWPGHRAACVAPAKAPESGSDGGSAGAPAPVAAPAPAPPPRAARGPVDAATRAAADRAVTAAVAKSREPLWRSLKETVATLAAQYDAMSPATMLRVMRTLEKLVEERGNGNVLTVADGSYMIGAGLLALLVRGMGEASHDAALAAVNAVENFTNRGPMSEVGVAAVIAAGGVPTFVELLARDHAFLRMRAGWGLRNVAVDNRCACVCVCACVRVCMFVRMRACVGCCDPPGLICARAVCLCAVAACAGRAGPRSWRRAAPARSCACSLRARWMRRAPRPPCGN